uniref:grancalcin isoform X3 n=1 Tax=Monopterus albus TaxID=43700 RepID=UPI0009B34292|nr:grancalcin-like isoform X3 [Monopterus albus]
MAFPGFGGYGGQIPGMPAQGMPPQGMQRGPMGGPMGGQMGSTLMGGPAPQGGYPPYGGGTFGGQPPTASDPMWGSFTAIAGQDGEVDAEELQRCLTQSGFTGSYTPFSLDTCRIMIAMLDRDMTGKMGFNEFKELFVALNGWKQNFMLFDHDRSGTIEPQEMSQAISTMDSFRRRDTMLQGSVTFQYDDFILCTMAI